MVVKEDNGYSRALKNMVYSIAFTQAHDKFGPKPFTVDMGTYHVNLYAQTANEAVEIVKHIHSSAIKSEI